MLNGSVSPDCAVIVLSIKSCIVDGCFLDDFKENPVQLNEPCFILELNLMVFVRLIIVVDFSGPDGRGKGKDPLVAAGQPTSNVLNNLGIVKVDDQVDHIGIASILTDIVAFP